MNGHSSAGMFWLHDAYHDGNGVRAWRRGWFQAILCILTILIGGFICIAGLWATIRQIKDAYANNLIPKPFVC